MLHQMHQRRPFPMIFLLLISVLVSLLRPSSCADEEIMRTRYTECRKRHFTCGKYTIDVSYPFNDGKPYCGHPAFELSCNSDESAITILVGEEHYRLVRDIDYSERYLTIADERFFSESCPLPSADSQFGFQFFDYNIDLNVEVYLWNCTTPISALLEVPCLSINELFYLSNDPTPSPEVPCSNAGVIWMNRTAVELMRTRKMTYDEALGEGFVARWAPPFWQNCSNCINSSGVCGFDNLTQSLLCFSTKSTATSSVSTLSGSSSKNGMILATVLGVMCFLLISAGLILLYMQNKNRGQPRNIPDIETFLQDYGSFAPKRYSYADLKLITKSFSTKLGEGGYGSVYQGQLKDGRQVAVKILSKSKDNGTDFMNEVASIGRTSHVNIVSLLGFCVDGYRRALVYELMANGSLEKYIYSDEPKTCLSWDKLFQVAIGVARGLEYLHRGCSTRIVHFDIKPHNILLDADFCPKISDFGLAKLCSHKQSRLSMAGARGTIGYIAPEVFSRQFGPVTTKSDVYSYGMMVLEMVGGRRNVKECDKSSEVYFPNWVYEHLDRDEDLQACDVAPGTKGIARKMILVGLWCIQAMPANRPSMSRVVEMLEGSVGDVEMPPKPYISSPVRSAVGSPVQLFVESSSTH